MTEAAIIVVFPLLMAYAAFSDLFTMTIPNRVPLILIAAFAVVATATGMDIAAITNHLAAMLLVFGVCLGLFAAGAMGGGDAKLLTASALWFGLGFPLLNFLIVTTLIGGALTLVILNLRSPAGAYLLSRVPMSHNLTNPSIGVPYGIAIGAAGLICYPETPLMMWAMARLV